MFALPTNMINVMVTNRILLPEIVLRDLELQQYKKKLSLTFENIKLVQFFYWQSDLVFLRKEKKVFVEPRH